MPINFQGERWDCDSGDDDNCGDGSVRVWVAYWVLFPTAWIISALFFKIRYLDRSTVTDCKARYFSTIVFATVCAGLWPAILLGWLLCGAPCHIFTCVGYLRARRAEKAARRRQDEAICYLSQFPPENKWGDRGWLVMLRARHQAFLTQQQQGSRVWLCRRKAKGGRGIMRGKMDDPLAIAGGEPSAGTRGVTDIELCEEGKSKQEFARAVVSVVDIMEDGLFREILLFL